jgi:hypothetical protein
VISSAFTCEFAYSWYFVSLHLVISLSGYHHLDGLEQQRRFGTSWEIVHGRLWRLVRGFAPFSVKSHKVALIYCVCH